MVVLCRVGSRNSLNDCRSMALRFYISSCIYLLSPRILLTPMKFFLHRNTVVPTLFSCLAFISCRSFKQVNAPHAKAAGQLIIQHLLASPKYMMYETSFLNSVHYAEVCAAFGAVQLARQNGDTANLKSLYERYAPLTHQSIARQTHHVDGNVYGILPLSLYQWNHDTTLKAHGLYMADTQWENPLPDGLTPQARYWIDDLFMVNALQVEAFKVTGQSGYLNRAALFTKKYLDSLQQPNGLFYHGPEAPVYWGRGNGWVAAGVAILLTTLPDTSRFYKPIATAFTRMMHSLLPFQSPNGMWRQIIDHPQAWEESSCTAMFAYAMAVGINAGLLERKQFDRPIQKAYKTLLAHLDDQGRLTGICAGTGQSKDLNYYLGRPQVTGDFHGQAPMLWLLYELGMHK